MQSPRKVTILSGDGMKLEVEIKKEKKTLKQQWGQRRKKLPFDLCVLVAEPLSFSRNVGLDLCSNNSHAVCDQTHMSDSLLHDDGGQVGSLSWVAGVLCKSSNTDLHGQMTYTQQNIPRKQTHTNTLTQALVLFLGAH